MHFQVIDSAISTCEEHIEKLDPSDIAEKEVETYIVSGLVILIVSEYEEYLQKAFCERADQCGDQFVSNYIKHTLSQKFRSPDLGKINDTLKRFDETYRDDFKNEIENSQHHAAWDSIMKARHAIVHKKGQMNMTFIELKSAYQLTKNIIHNVEFVLGIAS